MKRINKPIYNFQIENRPYQYDLKEIQKHFFIIVSKDPIVPCVSGCTFVTENTSLFLKVLGGYWSTNCLNNWLDLLDKIRSFVNGNSTLFAVKIGRKPT